MIAHAYTLTRFLSEVYGLTSAQCVCTTVFLMRAQINFCVKITFRTHGTNICIIFDKFKFFLMALSMLPRLQLLTYDPLDLVKSNIHGLQNLQCKECQKSNKQQICDNPSLIETRIGPFGVRVDGNIQFSKFFDVMRLSRTLRPLRLLRSLRLLRFLMPGKSLSI